MICGTDRSGAATVVVSSRRTAGEGERKGWWNRWCHRHRGAGHRGRPWKEGNGITTLFCNDFFRHGGR